ncbi:carbon storage regulator CsrA [Pseudomonas orientalis]|uniref:Translational regulator CsrA n=1 Tax=Pseudomonas orientalis TaxID=76758 RepID=A0A1H2EYP9_9PSED|nr:carbon storage regulator CsrA [Pseudomonas orientalis]KRP67527.1 carbon storage regulator [Pseudomonas orientalis]SDT99858.1 carbon storage regulator, CsrA [Pseudomonas orientalis]
MLVLSRLVGQTLSIGDGIAVHILEINGSHVKFGIDAPAEVKVHRAEIYQKIQQRQKALAQSESMP